MEHRLAGGRNSGAVLVGQTVRRPARVETPAVHALLRHLHAVGFDRAPQPLGVDERGREVLTYLDGETIGEARPWPAWAHSDAALLAAGRWLRDFHAASASFLPPPGAHWHGRNQLRAGEIIGHHDAAPYNAIWRPDRKRADTIEAGAGELIGFIDWDLAGPCLPIQDLAFVTLTWVPLTARDVAVQDGFPAELDRARRLRLLLDAYGWTGTRAEVLTAVRQRAGEHAAGLRSAARAGYQPAIRLVAEGVAEAFDRAVAELDTARNALLA
jgi:Ser/Thr protein kinase RdoA (MazF antagonist)